MFESLLTSRDRSRTKPFFDPAMGLSISEAIRSIEKAQKADADDNVLFIYAHDKTIEDVVDFFPKAANQWYEKGWRDQVFWKFLEDFKDAVEKGGK
jgi:glyoxylase-like metal-dependent hydrolase (beta-lactamase superfamily II)